MRNPVLLIGAGDFGAKVLSSVNSELESFHGERLPAIQQYSFLNQKSLVLNDSDSVSEMMTDNLVRSIAIELNKDEAIQENSVAPKIEKILELLMLADDQRDTLSRKLNEAVTAGACLDHLDIEGIIQTAKAGDNLAAYINNNAAISILESVELSFIKERWSESLQIIKEYWAQSRISQFIFFTELLSNEISNAAHLLEKKLAMRSEAGGKDRRLVITCLESAVIIYYQNQAECIRKKANDAQKNVRSLLSFVSFDVEGTADSRWKVLHEATNLNIYELARKFINQLGGLEQVANSTSEVLFDKLMHFSKPYVNEENRLLFDRGEPQNSPLAHIAREDFMLLDPQFSEATRNESGGAQVRCDIDKKYSDEIADDDSGPCRAYARASVWDKFAEIESSLRQKIEQACSSNTVILMSEKFPDYDSTQIDVIIIADLEDPFASGVVLDITGIIAQITGGTIGRHTVGVFTIPHVPAGLLTGNRSAAECYAALKEIYHHSREFRATYDRFQIAAVDPINTIYLLETYGQNMINVGPTLAPIVREFILTRFYGDISDIRAAERDALNSARQFFSFGVGILNVPQEQIALALANTKAAEICRRIAGAPDEDYRIPIVSQRLEKLIEELKEITPEEAQQFYLKNKGNLIGKLISVIQAGKSLAVEDIYRTVSELLMGIFDDFRANNAGIVECIKMVDEEIAKILNAGSLENRITEAKDYIKQVKEKIELFNPDFVNNVKHIIPNAVQIPDYSPVVHSRRKAKWIGIASLASIVFPGASVLFSLMPIISGIAGVVPLAFGTWLFKENKNRLTLKNEWMGNISDLVGVIFAKKLKDHIQLLINKCFKPVLNELDKYDRYLDRMKENCTKLAHSFDLNSEEYYRQVFGSGEGAIIPLISSKCYELMGEEYKRETDVLTIPLRDLLGYRAEIFSYQIIDLYFQMCIDSLDFSVSRMIERLTNEAGESVDNYFEKLSDVAYPLAVINEARTEKQTAPAEYIGVYDTALMEKPVYQGILRRLRLSDANVIKAIDHTKIFLIRSWQKAIDIEALGSITKYFQAYQYHRSAYPLYAVAGHEGEGGMRDLTIDPHMRDTTREIIVLALALGQFTLEKGRNLDQAVQSLRPYTSIIDKIKRPVSNIISDNRTNPKRRESLANWLEYVASNKWAAIKEAQLQYMDFQTIRRYSDLIRNGQATSLEQFII